MDSMKRTVVKTIFFKIGTTGITALFIGVGAAIGLHIILTLFYLIYERVWTKIKWGMKEKAVEQETTVENLILTNN